MLYICQKFGSFYLRSQFSWIIIFDLKKRRKHIRDIEKDKDWATELNLTAQENIPRQIENKIQKKRKWSEHTAHMNRSNASSVTCWNVHSRDIQHTNNDVWLKHLLVLLRSLSSIAHWSSCKRRHHAFVMLCQNSKRQIVDLKNMLGSIFLHFHSFLVGFPPFDIRFKMLSSSENPVNITFLAIPSTHIFVVWVRLHCGNKRWKSPELWTIPMRSNRTQRGKSRRHRATKRSGEQREEMRIERASERTNKRKK